MPSLEKYLKNTIPEFSTIISSKDVSNEFIKFLRTTIVVSDQNAVRSVRVSLKELESYTNFIDSLLSLLIQENIPSILVTGYTDPSLNNNWKSKLVNPSMNLHVKLLRGKCWRTLYSVIGGSALLELILKYKAYEQSQDGRLIQVFGCLSKSNYAKVQGITNSSMLYRTRHGYKVTGLFASSSKTILESIYSSELDKRKTLPKNFRKLSMILKTVKLLDQNCRYNSIFENVIPVTDSRSLLKSCTPIHSVIKFVLIIMNKVFPLEIWGSSANKSHITERVVEFINSGSHVKILFNDLIKYIKISDIEWLGKSRTMTSQQDSAHRISTFIKFLEWFFMSFIQKVIQLFWHVTESASLEDSKLYYFPHSVWNIHRSEFMDKYIETYLVPVTENDTCYIKGLSTKFNHGHSRLIPKTNDFRLICIPSRMPFRYPEDATDRDKQIFEFLSYANETINPIRHILKSRLSDNDMTRTLKCSPRCYSVGDVARNIVRYKASLLEKNNNKLPELFFVKFDMRHCYDNLSHAKVIEEVERLFENQEDSKTYFVRNYYSSKIGSTTRRKQVSFVKDSGQLDEFDLDSANKDKRIRKRNVLIDRSKMFKFTKKDVLSICRSQICDSLMLENKTYYRRKTGVFQGFPLSSTFCDIVYNNLVDLEFSFLESDPENLLLRVVDDFLLVTTNISACKRVTRLINGDFLDEYGAFVNIDKTQIVGFQLRAPTLKFIGLDINTVTLEITREFPKDAFSALKSKRSFPSSYSYLSWSYKSRLTDFLVSLKSGTLDSAFHNIKALLASVLDSFIINFHNIAAYDQFEDIPFVKFLLDLLEKTLSKFETLNSSSIYNEEIKLHFKSTICDSLSRRSRFNDIINCIMQN